MYGNGESSPKVGARVRIGGKVHRYFTIILRLVIGSIIVDYYYLLGKINLLLVLAWLFIQQRNAERTANPISTKEPSSIGRFFCFCLPINPRYVVVSVKILPY